ncbi:outer membrane protein transport protein [Hydrogenimonas thermophila]|uniref:OmpP1/FadL family transporter n=1 Tax=Hydrogenimonas thermophila TaxID=223786 RepID=UPI002936ED1E|nr:porin [Hydrogenimonas thermophila]WOE69632.1 outer membrane protein transport protein [Hydrogenimonas thermophila]WOE72146.1 outer membrane protein transport protein [Hydrogenimonas thermophila]
MKKVIVLSATLSVALFATHGDNLIGAGTKSRAIAGAASSTYLGAESIFINPALLTKASKSEFSIGTTLFMPDVTAKNSNASGEVAKSKSDFEVIPYLGYVKSIDDKSSFGIGLFSVSGMGVDYSDEPVQKGLAGMKTHLVYAKLSTVYARSFGKLSLGGGVDISYGDLEMHMINQFDGSDLGSNGDSHIGAGYHLGANYEFNENIDFSLTYTSEVHMKYKGVFDFNFDGTKDDLTLTQPAEVGTAVAYSIDSLRLEADYKRIFWSKADGYKDFQWDDQNVISLGATWNYNEKWTFRGGYSYAKSPLHNKEYKDGVVEGFPFPSQQIAFFNLVGFPAITQTHYSVGASYKIDDAIQINAAYVYAPKATESFAGIEASNSQSSFSFGLDYRF